MNEIQVNSTKRPNPFPRGENNKNILSKFLKKSFLKPLGTNLVQMKHPPVFQWQIITK